MAIHCRHSIGKKYEEMNDDGEFEDLLTQKEWPHKFDRGGRPILWKLLNDTKDIEGQKREEKLIAYAMLAWSFQTDLEVKMARGDEDADITIFFKNGTSEKTFRESPGTLAFAYFPGQPSVEGLVVFNDDYLWTVDGKPVNRETFIKITGEDVPPTSNLFKTYDLQHTMTHELGHTFGLRHEANFRDHVMWPYYNRQRVPQHNDLKRMGDKYGIRKLRPWRKLVIRIILARGPRV